MKTRMVSGAKLAIYGERGEDGVIKVRLKIPQYGRGENYYTKYSKEIPGMLQNLEFNKQRILLLGVVSGNPEITSPELIDLGFDSELVGVILDREQ